MSRATRCCVFALLLLGATVRAEDKPATRQQLDHAEALKLFTRGALHEQDHQIRDAIKAYEAALRLDPETTAIQKAVIPLYFSVERFDDAFSACQRVLEREPGDFETGYLYARQLRERGRTQEALAVLQRAAKCVGLKERPIVQAKLVYDLGLMHEEANQLAEAEQAFQQAAALLDDADALQCAETWECLGRLRLRLNKPEDAVRAFQQASKKDPARARRLAYQLAEVYAELNKPAEALSYVNDYLRQLPSALDAYELKIKLLKKLGREDELITSLQTAVERDSHNLGLQLLLAREYRAARRNTMAEELYLRLARDQPTPEVFKGLLALYKDDVRQGGVRALALLNENVAAANGKEDKDEKEPGDEKAAAKARAMLIALRGDAEMVRRLLPAAHRALLRGDDLNRQTRLLLAALAARTNQLDAAEELFRGYLREPFAAHKLEPEVYSGLLRVLMLAHKYEAVVKLCEQGLETAQTTSRVLFYLDLAHAQLALERRQEALAAATAAVDASGDKDRLLCRRIRVDVLAACDKSDEAVAECQALLKEYAQPDEIHEIRAALSMAYTAARKYDESEQELQKILDAKPDDATAHNDLGYQWADRCKHLPEAEQLIRKALELDKRERNSGTAVGLDADQDNAAYVDSLGWTLFRRGKLDEARKELERASTLPAGVEDPTVWDHLGDVYFRQALKAKAETAWRTALKLYDAGHRRRNDGRYDDLKRKLKLLET